MEESTWGLQKGELAIDDSFQMKQSSTSHKMAEHEAIILGGNFAFPLDFSYEKIFIGGKTGSGKSYTAGVLMEEMSRHGIQFVCFDALNAHDGINDLPNVERISPSEGENINVHKLIHNLKNSNSSLIINLTEMKLETQQKVLAEYCEAVLAEDFEGKPIMTILEECQDFVPQLGKPESFNPVVRLCKLGRGKGLGATLISQRPAAVHKEALSQVSTYMVHNIINTRDLEALKNQLSFGTDKETIRVILSSISYATPGEMVCFSPKYFKDDGYIKVGKIDRERVTEHGGKNIEVHSKLSSESLNVYNNFEQPSSSFGSITSVSEILDAELTEGKSPDASNYLRGLDGEGLDGEGFDDFNFEGEGDEDTYEMEWNPNYGVEVEGEGTPLSKIKDGSKSMKAITAVGLFTTGIYLITRGLTKGGKASE